MKKIILALTCTALLTQIVPNQTLNSATGDKDDDSTLSFCGTTLIIGGVAISGIALLFDDLYRFNEKIKELKKIDQAPTLSNFKDFVIYLSTKYAIPMVVAKVLIDATADYFEINDTKRACTVIVAIIGSHVARTDFIENVAWATKKIPVGVYNWTRGKEGRQQY